MYKVAYTEENCLRFTNIGGQAEGRNDPPNFFKKLFFLLIDNCFAEFCCFLSNLNLNQP